MTRNELVAIPFTEKFITGIDIIDQQHQSLLKLYNYMVNKLNAGDGVSDSPKILKHLFEYTQYHFSTEERMMKACGYPGAYDHRNQHQSFVELVTKLVSTGVATKESMQKLAQFLGRWIQNHILIEDMETGKFLKTKNPPLESETKIESEVANFVKNDRSQDRAEFAKKEIQIHRFWLNGKSKNKAQLEFSDISGINLDGVNLSSANLTGANMAKTCLRGANLSNAILVGVDLEDADLSDANLTGADLRGANLHHAQLTAAILRGADLCTGNVVTTDAHLAASTGSRPTILSEANLERAVLCQANLSGCDFTGADLGEADLAGANLSGAVMIGVDLHGARLKGAVMTGTVIDLAMIDEESVKTIAAMGGVVQPSCQELQEEDFFTAIKDHEQWIDSGGQSGGRLDLDRVKIPNVAITGRNLAGCRLRRCHVDGGDWHKVDLSMSDLSYTNMAGISLKHGILRGVILRRANLTDANLSSAVFDALPLATGGRVWPTNFEGALLTRADLSLASLDGVILRNVDLTGCNVTGIKVRNADFDGAKR